jgi:hypothetical protein
VIAYLPFSVPECISALLPSRLQILYMWREDVEGMQKEKAE